MLPALLWGIEKKIVSKISGNIVLALLVGGVICTISRKGIITMVLSFFIYFTLKKQFKKVFISGIIFFFIGMLFAGYSMISQRFDIKTLEAQFKGRLEIASSGLEMFRENPLKGLGYNGFYENILRYQPSYTTKKLVAHNNYITALSNYGLLGFIPLISIFIYPLFISLKIVFWRKTESKDTNAKDMAIICLSCVVPFMISAFFAGSLFYNYAIMPLVFTHISLVFSANHTVVHKDNIIVA
jgi:O-antigen ligase